MERERERPRESEKELPFSYSKRMRFQYSEHVKEEQAEARKSILDSTKYDNTKFWSMFSKNPGWWLEWFNTQLLVTSPALHPTRGKSGIFHHDPADIRKAVQSFSYIEEAFCKSARASLLKPMSDEQWNREIRLTLAPQQVVSTDTGTATPKPSKKGCTIL